MDSFVKLLSWIKNELLALKTANIRSSAQIATISKSSNISFTLKKNTPGTQAISNEYAKLTITPTLDQPILAQVTEDISDTLDRSIRTARISGAGTSIIIYMWVHGNQNDLDILNAGGSVSVSYPITVTATADFNLSITYEAS